MPPSPDFIATLGPLALTLRLRRVADRFTEDARRLYETMETPLEPGWYALLLLLHRWGPMSVTEAATCLRLRHPSVVETSKKLQNAGLLIASTDPKDKRRRVLELSDEAKQQLPEFEVLWNAFRDELTDLLDSAHGDLLAVLDRLEARLDEQGLDQRIQARLEHQGSPSTQPRKNLRVTIHPIEATHRDAVLHIAHELVRSGETYAYDPNISDEDLWSYWSPPHQGQGYVALAKRQVVGMFVLRPNHPGPGSHVANASYAVRADLRGLGLGRQLGEASLQLAKELGYRAMQFNIVISTNRRALRLWRSLGFRIVGTIPEGFRCPDGKLVAHHILYKTLV